MKTFKILKQLIDDYNFEYEVFHHKPVRTSQEASEIRPDYKLSQGAKAIILKGKKNRNAEYTYFMLVLPGDRRFNSRRVKSILNFRRLSFASEEEVLQITDGVKPGGVPPFGSLFGLITYVDRTLSDNIDIIFNAGDRKISLAMEFKDWYKVEQPEVVEVVE